jgi:PAS domain-containing protein
MTRKSVKTLLLVEDNPGNARSKTMMYQTIANGEVWHGKIRNRTKDGSFYWASTIVARILNSEGKTRHYQAIRADTTENIPPLLPSFRLCSVTYSRAASRDLDRHLGEPEEPNSSSHFESIRDSSLTILFRMDYAT